MRLKRLIIQGFKSFKDRTVINFDDGITGIVGPNGCGKSNIVDALFWVMGEQSAKHLRGNSMKDLIFAGSSKYNKGAFAEASLILDNSDGKHIHIAGRVASPSEIQLTRKLYRNGETEYRINGSPCRLKDIQEVFMDTGAGAKSYSIIAQGEINRLVQAKPEERRTMIEEVAGITKYKLRKRESLKKIEQTQQNLGRLNDLQSEIEKNLRSLQGQAERAEKAKLLKEKIQRHDLTVQSHKIFDHLKAIREFNQNVLSKKTELQTWETQKIKLESSLEEERIEKEERTEKLESHAFERNQISNQLAAAQERLKSLAKELKQKEELLEGRQKELELALIDLGNRESKLEELREQRIQLINQKNEEFDFSEAEEELATLKEKVELQEDQVLSLREKLDAKKEEYGQLSQKKFQNESRLNELATSLQDTTAELEELEKQYSGVSKLVSNERSEINFAEKNLNEAKEKEGQKRQEIQSQTVKVSEVSEEFKVLSKELITTTSRLESLKQIRAQSEGVSEGTAVFLNGASQKYSLLGDLIQCEEGYAPAVEALLADVVENLVSKDGGTIELAQWLVDKDVSVQFLKAQSIEISEEARERLSLAMDGDLISLVDHVSIDESYKEKLMPYMSGFYLVKDLNIDHLAKIPLSIPFNGISSFDGKVLIKRRGSSLVFQTKSEEQEGMGVVARNNLIETLESLRKELELKVTALEDQLSAEEVLLSQMNKDLDGLRSEVATLNAHFAAKKSGLESRLSAYEMNSSRIEILKKRQMEISKSRFAFTEEREKIDFSESQFEEELDGLKEEFELGQEQLVDVKSTYESRREDFVAKQVEINTYKNRLDSIEQQIKDYSEQIEKEKKRLESGQEMLDRYNQEADELEALISKQQQDNQTMADTLAERDEMLSLLKEQLNEIVFGMQDREEQVKKLVREINKNDKEIAEMSAKIERSIEEEVEIVRNVFEKYQIDLRESVGRFLQYSEEDYVGLKDTQSMYTMETEFGRQQVTPIPYEFSRKYGQDLKDSQIKLKSYKTDLSRLGEINWQAIKDYERQKLRFEFLKVQEEELRSSLQDLLEAINHINEKSRERFKIAYEEVNSRFQKVFPIIFGGGNATLNITGDIDDPECGVDIIAQPPGKKMQNINLMSGGEKALTAVSLIFSIFLVKPSPFCLLDEVDAPLDDANVGRFNELLREMSHDSQFILITHNKKTMELNDTLYGVTMQEPGVSKAVSVQLH